MPPRNLETIFLISSLLFYFFPPALTSPKGKKLEKNWAKVS